MKCNFFHPFSCFFRLNENALLFLLSPWYIRMTLLYSPLFQALGKCDVCISSPLYLFASKFDNKFVSYLLAEHSNEAHWHLTLG